MTDLSARIAVSHQNRRNGAQRNWTVEEDCLMAVGRGLRITTKWIARAIPSRSLSAVVSRSRQFPQGAPLRFIYNKHLCRRMLRVMRCQAALLDFKQRQRRAS